MIYHEATAVKPDKPIHDRYISLFIYINIYSTAYIFDLVECEIDLPLSIF